MVQDCMAGAAGLTATCCMSIAMPFCFWLGLPWHMVCLTVNTMGQGPHCWQGTAKGVMLSVLMAVVRCLYCGHTLPTMGGCRLQTG